VTGAVGDDNLLTVFRAQDVKEVVACRVVE
jgi:hypothetical protein